MRKKKDPFKEHVAYVDAMCRLLKAEERNELVNGCGSGKFFLRVFKPPRRYCQMFFICCNWHDIGYYIGGTELHRKYVDTHFYQECVRTAGLSLGGQFWAIMMWRAVRRGGKFTFEHRPKPAGVDYLRSVAIAKKEKREADEGV